MDNYAIGQGVPRIEDPRLLRGGGRYVDDIVLPRMCRLHVLRSPHGNAQILTIDTAKAKEAPGVLLVLTGEDYRASGYGPLPIMRRPHRNALGIAPFFPQRLPLAHDHVRFVGDCVAAVIAETQAEARDAAELIDVTYEPQPAATTTMVGGGAPAVWNERPDNIAFIHDEGDLVATEAGFAKAHRIVRQRLVISRVMVNPMETRGCIASYDVNADEYLVHSGLQSAYGARQNLAEIFGEPDTKFHVVVDDVGGSFGLKGVYPEHILVAWASRLLGRPVKWIADRSEAFLGDHHGRDNVSDAELALDKDGNFLAVRVATTANLGAYVSPIGTGPPVNNIGSIAGIYRTPALFARVIGVFTHTCPTGPYRGAGRPEAAYVIERLVDQAAREMGVDPIELRRRNVIPAAAMPFKTGLTFTYDTGDFGKSMDMAVALADYRGIAARKAASLRRGKLLGIGVAAVVERATIVPGLESVEIRFTPSGGVTVLAGTTENGQGHRTMYTQVVCDRLGIDPATVRVVEGDTRRLAIGSGTGGSRVSAMGSSAAILATRKIIDKGRKIAAHTLEAAEADIEFRNGAYVIAGTDRSLSIVEIAKLAFMPARLPAGLEPGLSETGTHRASEENFPNGCHICEVEIDTETGAVAIVRYSVVDDVGTIINPHLVEGQVHGGIVQGAGQALMEMVGYDATGQLVTGSFMDYAMPRGSDVCMIDSESFAVPTQTNLLGVKGVGEAGTVGALPAVINAVIDALSPIGVRQIDMPATSELIWRAIVAARNTDAKALE
jgi:aerobic carbon-monoxide dehydrogenase large subunit